jgi:hypothetical protein
MIKYIFIALWVFSCITSKIVAVTSIIDASILDASNIATNSTVTSNVDKGVSKNNVSAIENSQHQIWPLIIKNCNTEKFMARFPFDPKINETKNFVILSSEDNGVKYSLMRKNINTTTWNNENIIKMILSELKCSQIISSSVKKDLEKLIVNLEYKKGNETFKITVFILPKSFYVLTTSFKNKDLEQHQYFADSFILDVEKNTL